MTGLYISFLVVGIILFIGSFIFVQKLTPSDIEEIKKLSEQELNTLIDVEFQKKEAELTVKLTEKADTAYDEFDHKTDREMNEKILEIGKYVEEVNGDIEEKTAPLVSVIDKSHDEIIFMYDRLNDKQEKLTAMTADMQKMESELRFLKDGISDLLKAMDEKEATAKVADEARAVEARAAVASAGSGAVNGAEGLSGSEGLGGLSGSEGLAASGTTDLGGSADGATAALQEELLSMKQELEKRISDVSERVSANAADGAGGKSLQEEREERQQEILKMKNEGFSEIEIAKKMGIGLGEVKLVLGLFQ